ncbi:MAG: hypothetical protein ACOH5I_17960 [Oligoflexus sp.]
MTKSLKPKKNSKKSRSSTRVDQFRHAQPNSVFTRKIRLPTTVKRRGGLIFIGAILGIALPLSIRLLSERDQVQDAQRSQVSHQDVTSQQREVQEPSSMEQQANSRSSSGRRSSGIERENTRPAAAAGQAANSGWLSSSTPRNRQSRARSTSTNNRQVRATRSTPSPTRPVARQVNPAPATSNPTSEMASRSSSSTPSEARIAMVEPPAPAPSRFVSDLRLSYSPTLVERCAAECILVFRDSQGTLVRGTFSRSQFQAVLLQSAGEALFSGILSVRQSQAWLEITGVKSMRPPLVVEAPVASPPPTPVSPVSTVALPSATNSSANDSEPSPSAEAKQPSVDSTPSVTTQDNSPGVQRFQNRLRKIRSVPTQKEDDAEEELSDEQQDTDEPYNRFHQRLRRSTGSQ